MKISYRFFCVGDNDVKKEYDDYDVLYTSIKSKLQELLEIDEDSISYVLEEIYEEITALILKFFLSFIPFEIFGRKIRNLYYDIVKNDKLLITVLDDSDIKRINSYCNVVDIEKIQVFTNIEKLYFSNLRDKDVMIDSYLANLDKSTKDTVVKYITNYEKIESKKKYLLETKLGNTNVSKYILLYENNLRKLSNNTPFQNLSIVGNSLQNFDILSTSKNLSALYTYTPSLLGKKVQYASATLLFSNYLILQLYRTYKDRLLFSSLDDVMKLTMK